MHYILLHPIKPGYFNSYKSIDNKLRLSPVSYPKKLNFFVKFCGKKHELNLRKA